MDNLFNNIFNILLLIILKKTTYWSAAYNFESFINSFDCYVVQMFLSTWNEINFIRCCTRLGTRIGTNIERVGVKFVFSNVSLEQDSRVNLIRGLSWFLDVVSSLDKLLHWYFQPIDYFLGWTFWFLFFFDRIAFYISSICFGKVVVLYWVASMAWWIQNRNLECGLYMVIISRSSRLRWSCCWWWDICCEKN